MKNANQIYRESFERLLNENCITHCAAFDKEVIVKKVQSIAQQALAEAEKAVRTFSIEEVESVTIEAVENSLRLFRFKNDFGYNEFNAVWWKKKKKELLGDSDE